MRKARGSLPRLRHCAVAPVQIMRLWAAMGRCASMRLLTGAAALDCHADFWPEMHASPRRLEALILANGALVKLCFDADADGAVHRQHARAFLKAAGLVDVTVAGGLEDVLQRNDAVEAIVEVLFAARTRRPTTRRCIKSGSRAGEAAAAITCVFGARRLRRYRSDVRQGLAGAAAGRLV